MPPAPLRPRALRRGDWIGIAAPASPVREDLLARGEAVLSGLGFRVRRPTHLLARGRYTAGGCKERTADLEELLGDPEVRAIVFARGGYGSPHVVPRLDPGLLRSDPKLLMGASDLTALLLWALRAGVACVHGPMAARELQEGRVDAAELVRLLTRKEPLGRMEAPGLRVLHPGRAAGAVTGGCLSLVVASLGTTWEVETDGAILFLEDVDTKPYQIDRMLTQLDQAGKLSRVSGIAFGEMLRCLQSEAQGYTLDEVLRDLTAGLGVPVVAGLPCGHTAGIHRPLPFGLQATLDAVETPASLTIDEPLVV